MDLIEGVGRRPDLDEPRWGDLGGLLEIGDRSLNGLERNVLFHNRGKGPDGLPRFSEVAWHSGTDVVHDGRGLAVADFDRDGRQDILLRNYRRPATLLMARGDLPGPGKWLQLELVAVANRSAIGARVEARAGDRLLVRHVAAGAGFMSCLSSVVHFGLGAADQVDLTVRWPSGKVIELKAVQAGQRMTVFEDAERN